MNRKYVVFYQTMDVDDRGVTIGRRWRQEGGTEVWGSLSELLNHYGNLGWRLHTLMPETEITFEQVILEKEL